MKMFLKKINWNEPIPFKLACPDCQPYDDVKQADWEFFVPDTPESIETAKNHCCPACYRMWRKTDF